MAETIHPVVAAHVSSRGPRFFRTDEGVMFEITLDSRSKIGPRPMVEVDKHQYPKAWEAFETGEEVGGLEPRLTVEDDPNAKAIAENEAAKRQAAMDRKRGGGL